MLSVYITLLLLLIYIDNPLIDGSPLCRLQALSLLEDEGGFDDYDDMLFSSLTSKKDGHLVGVGVDGVQGGSRKDTGGGKWRY